MNLKDHDEAAQYLNEALALGQEELCIALGNVAKARMELSMLATLCDMDKESVYRICQGRRKPTLNAIAKICNALGFKIEIKRNDG